MLMALLPQSRNLTRLRLSLREAQMKSIDNIYNLERRVPTYLYIISYVGVDSNIEYVIVG